MAVVITFVVYRTAWISDDAIITFRYISNFRHGQGAVFNVGERVQGYTHPLWFVLLSGVSVLTGDEVFAAIALSLALTLAAAIVLGSRLVQVARTRITGLVITALVLVLLGSSDSWRSFQTSGLEGALSTALLVIFVVSALEERPRALRGWRVLLAGALLVLCRPDFALLVTPAGAFALLATLRKKHCWRAAAALTPLLGFLVSWSYYGELLPNTGAAKLGIYTVAEGVAQGLAYLLDWVKNEPVVSLASLALLAFGMRRLRTAGALAGVTALGVAAYTLAPAQTRELDHGIINERAYWVPGHALAAYIGSRELNHDPQLDAMRAYLDVCGRTTIHSYAPAALGYYAGPKLTVIDTLGLTDRFIARLPRSALRARPPRPGHPYKNIPIAYLARRGDIAILPDWEARMAQRDCSLAQQLHPYEGDTGTYPP